MKPFQERVVEEKKQLDQKRVKLEAFIRQKSPGTGEDCVPLAEWNRLTEQLDVMLRYSAILGERIENFT